MYFYIRKTSPLPVLALTTSLVGCGNFLTVSKGDVAVLIRVVGMVRKLTVGDEPFEELLHDRLCGIVVQYSLNKFRQ